MIQVEQITKYYGRTAAVQDVSFTVREGEVLGFLGLNGAGKTTTMRILTGFFPPSSGRVLVGGTDLARAPEAVKRRIGYLPELIPLYPEMRVTPYLLFVAEAKGVAASRRRERLAAVLEECGLVEMAQAPIHTLSKGFRQRLGLAQALINDPDILILDEPTVGLDPKQIVEIRRLIKGCAGRKTVILSTHILPEVSVTCQRVVIIHRGRIVAETDLAGTDGRRLGRSDRQGITLSVEGPAEEILAAVRETRGVHRADLAEPASAGGVAVIALEAESGIELRNALASLVIGRGWGLVELRGKEATLEDLFIQQVSASNGGTEGPGDRPGGMEGPGDRPGGMEGPGTPPGTEER